MKNYWAFVRLKTDSPLHELVNSFDKITSAFYIIETSDLFKNVGRAGSRIDVASVFALVGLIAGNCGWMGDALRWRKEPSILLRRQMLAMCLSDFERRIGVAKGDGSRSTTLRKMTKKKKRLRFQKFLTGIPTKSGWADLFNRKRMLMKNLGRRISQVSSSVVLVSQISNGYLLLKKLGFLVFFLSSYFQFCFTKSVITDKLEKS